MSITTSCNQIQRAHEGSGIPEQYWELASQYRAELIAQACGILGSRDDAEDVVQETFYEAFRDVSKLSPESLGSSLRLINRSNALDRLKTRGRARQRDQRSITRSFTTGGFSGIELRETVEAALLTLPENLRAVVRLRYFEHLSYKEISERLKIPMGAVGPLLSQAGQKLYTHLVPTAPTDTGTGNPS